MQEPAPGRWTDYDVFRIGAAVTGCLTMAVFLFALAKLPVRSTVSSLEIPGIKAPAIGQPIPSARPSALASAQPSAVPTVAPAAVPSAIPTVAAPEAPPSQPAAAPKASVPPPSPTPRADDHAAGAGPYTVRPGDTLFSIARRHGVSVQTLASLNNISDVSVVKAGEQIKVP